MLNKEGPLTDEEYQHIMTHPMVGWHILSPLLGDAQMALNVVRSHHERYDGRGIPDKLTGTAIPLEARIASVADAFDAMVSGRAYRRGRFMTQGGCYSRKCSSATRGHSSIPSSPRRLRPRIVRAEGL